MPRTRLRRPPGGLALALVALVGGAGSVGVLASAQQRSDDVGRVPNMEEVLTPNDGPAVNYLLVGSDSREDADAASADADQIGTTEDVTGARSDTIMILRREQDGGAALLSLPRDLWVEIAGTGEEGKINAAYNGGPERLASTISQSLGIPVQHYVEVDFAGFTSLVDQLGGVQICFEFPTRDTRSGLDAQAGCQTLDGTQSLAFTRSRYFEEFVDGDWRMDGRADLGRIERQQQFIREAVTQVLLRVEGNPFALSELITAASSAISVDEQTDPVQAANALRTAANAGLLTYNLDVDGIERNGQSALELLDSSQPVLDYFRGVGPAPVVEVPPPTTAPG